MATALQKPDTLYFDDERPPHLEQFIEDKLVPILSKAKKNPQLHADGMGQLKLPMMGGMVGFIAAFLITKSFLPNSALGEIATFIAFPVLFISSMILTAFLCRHRIAEAMLIGRDNFLLRTEALTALCAQLGLEYIPIPGGPNKPTKYIAGLRYCPQILKDFCDLMDDHGGFDDVAEIIRDSGLALPRETVLASEKNREEIYKRQIESQQFEDGVKGTVDGIPFSALEWTENLDESKRHHLLIILKLPTRLTGRVEFKNKAGRWPAAMPKWKKQPVRLISKAFTKNYSVRACDQVEARLIFDPSVIERLTAYAASDAVCGIAFENQLVVDLVGRNRFNLLNLASGEWSRDTIQTTLDDVQELREFVQTVSRAFALRPKALAT